jgi:hypothetical protein
MNRFSLPLCCFAVAAFSGCTTYDDPPPAGPVTTGGVPVVSAAPSPAPVTSSGATPVTSASAATVVSAQPASSYRAGQGIVESIGLVSLPASASAGGTARPSGPYRVAVRMDDGSSQNMVVDNRAFFAGDRVQIMPDGKLTRLPSP